MSAGVSGGPERAATTGIGTRAAVPNGAARSAACELGALAGRNLVLLFWVTLERDGSSDIAAIAPTTQAATTSQRNRTANDPIARKIAPICTRARIREAPCGAAENSHRVRQRGSAPRWHWRTIIGGR